MRQIKFPDSHEGRGAWVIAWAALRTYPVGDRPQTLTLRRTRRAVKKAALVTITKDADGKETGQENVCLRPGGGDVFLEEAEHGLLGKALDGFRSKLTGDNVEPLALLDELWSGAPEISSEEVDRVLASLGDKTKPREE